MAAEFWSVLGDRWSEPGGEPQADGEYKPAQSHLKMASWGILDELDTGY